MRWIDKLQARWKVGSVFQVIVILIVFTCTGLTVVYLMKPALRSFFGDEVPIWAKVVYGVLILPVYNILLLCFGFVLGQFRFFWEFEKRFAARMLSLFNKKQNR